MILENDYPPDTRVENEIKILNSAGFKISLICPTKNKSRTGIHKKENCKIFRFYINNFQYKSGVGKLKFPFYFNVFKNGIRKFLLENDEHFDAIHIHDLSILEIGLWLKSKSGKKLILDLHENYPYLIKDAQHTQKGLGKILSDYKQWIAYEKEYVREADYVITVVKEMEQRMLTFDNRPEKYHIYQNVVRKEDIPIYNPPSEDEVFKIIYVGGITPARGIQTMIKAIDLLPEDINIVFNIYGSGKYQPHLSQLIKEENVDSKVFLKGQISFDEVIPNIKRHDAAVIPHYRSVQNNNSSPNKLFLYMSTGRPVISSNCKSLERVLKESNAGLTYVDTDPRDLADQILKLYNDRKLSLKLGKNGHEATMCRYNTEVEGQNLVRLYKSI